MKVATCHTEGCENAEHPIALDFIPEGEDVDVVVCGACGQVVSDVAEQTEA